jgi:hypothetical protein
MPLGASKVFVCICHAETNPKLADAFSEAELGVGVFWILVWDAGVAGTRSLSRQQKADTFR